MFYFINQSFQTSGHIIFFPRHLMYMQDFESCHGVPPRSPVTESRHEVPKCRSAASSEPGCWIDVEIHVRQNYSSIICRFRDSALLGWARGNFGLKPSNAVHDVHLQLPSYSSSFSIISLLFDPQINVPLQVGALRRCTPSSHVRISKYRSLISLNNNLIYNPRPVK